LKEALSQAEKQLSDKDSEIDRITVAASKKTKESEELQKDLSKTQGLLDVRSQQVERLQTSYKTSRQELSRKSKEIRGLKGKLSRSQDQLFAQYGELESAGEKFRIMEADHEAQAEDLRSVRQQLQDKYSEVEGLQEQLEKEKEQSKNLQAQQKTKLSLANKKIESRDAALEKAENDFEAEKQRAVDLERTLRICEAQLALQSSAQSPSVVPSTPAPQQYPSPSSSLPGADLMSAKPSSASSVVASPTSESTMMPIQHPASLPTPPASRECANLKRATNHLQSKTKVSSKADTRVGQGAGISKRGRREKPTVSASNIARSVNSDGEEYLERMKEEFTTMHQEFEGYVEERVSAFADDDFEEKVKELESAGEDFSEDKLLDYCLLKAQQEVFEKAFEARQQSFQTGGGVLTGVQYWYGEKRKDLISGEVLYWVAGANGEAPLKIVVPPRAFKLRGELASAEKDQILPLPIQVFGEEKKIFAQQCILAQIPMCQFEAAKLCLREDQLEAFIEHHPKAAKTTKEENGETKIGYRLPTHGLREKTAMPMMWAKVVKTLSRTPGFKDAVQTIATERQADTISCWPTYDPVMRMAGKSREKLEDMFGSMGT
jgi:hypothetical protein